MRDLKEYWRAIHALEATLPAFVWLAPAQGGPLAESTSSAAARFLHEGSHRLATEEEIARQRADMDAHRKRNFEEGLRRKGVAVIPISRIL